MSNPESNHQRALSALATKQPLPTGALIDGLAEHRPLGREPQVELAKPYQAELAEREAAASGVPVEQPPQQPVQQPLQVQPPPQQPAQAPQPQPQPAPTSSLEQAGQRAIAQVIQEDLTQIAAQAQPAPQPTAPVHALPQQPMGGFQPAPPQQPMPQQPTMGGFQPPPPTQVVQAPVPQQMPPQQPVAPPTPAPEQAPAATNTTTVQYAGATVTIEGPFSAVIQVLRALEAAGG